MRRLSKVEDCADPERLDGAPALPDDPDTRRSIGVATEVLQQVRAQVALGHYANARALLSPVVGVAALVDHPPLSARVRRWLGDIDYY